MSTGTNSPLEIRIESSLLSPERTRVRKLSGREAISQLFQFDVEVVTLEGEGPEARALAGTEATIVFEQEGQELRRIHGMIAEAHDLLHALEDHRSYRLRLVPRAYRMALIENQETFLEVTIPDLIKQKLALVGLDDAELRLLGSYPTREFVAQFQESDLAFVSRLAEHAGISYFFDQSGGTDTMVFTDMSSGFLPAPGAASIHYRGRGEERDVFDFEVRNAVVPGVFVVRDYNYRTPMVDLTAEHPLPDGYAGGVIAWGDHYKTPGEGQQLAQIRAEERAATAVVYAGKSTICALGAGGRSTLEGHPFLGSIDMLIVEVHHEATQAVWAGEKGSYVNTFRGVPGQINYRPARVTPKPRIAGFVTAIVDAGAGGSPDYAQIDQQGRYMVRFLFDSAASGGRLASRPVRMIQNHAGENYGTHFPLKPGIEVLIAFVNGDPDRPLIVGAAPNTLTPSPVDARNRTTHRIKTMAGIRIDLVDE